ncbi:hypothetical protein V3595_14750 [Bacillus sp. CFBP9009]
MGTDFPEETKKPGLRQVSVDKLDENHLQFFKGLLQFERRFPLQALAFRGRSGSLLGAFAPAGSPLDAFFPQESRTLRSNQLCF